MKNRRRIAFLVSSVLLVQTTLSACVNNLTTTKNDETQNATEAENATEEETTEDKIPVEEKTDEQLEQMAKTYEEKGPKYIFLFIGDGMSYAQCQLASYYFDSVGQNVDATFSDFRFQGSTTTYNETSLIPDSASTITAIASGNKTAMGVINEDSENDVEYRTIAEYLKKVCGFKVGVMSSVAVNHATPAGFYAKNKDRNSYYEIGLDLIDSDFDYFAGGNFLLPNGADGTSEDLNKLASEAGYTLLNNPDKVKENIDADKILLTTGCEYNENSLSYRIDRENGNTSSTVSLADLVSSGIDYLGPNSDDDSGFFMMCEGGMIDWACHANDAAAMIYEMQDFREAVDEAIAFYNEYPDDTLILVTADHECGGLTLGYANTQYTTNYPLLSNQRISTAAYNNKYIANYKDEGVYFEGAMEDIRQLFGLTRPEYATEYTDPNLILTEDEVDDMYDAYLVTWDGYATDENGNAVQTSEEYTKYGNCMPFTVAALHILEHKAGIDFSTYVHTAVSVPIYAMGKNAKQFKGTYDDTEIYEKLMKIKGLSTDEEEE
ncbi:MAG: alkaline phosphatase [Lachnospiraceae bacterium]|nr:alkaline phosphatase [Lachnospiraceae bacterium]